MKRLGALVAAIALVVVAIWVRDRLTGDVGRGGLSGRLTCSVELIEACSELGAENPDLDWGIEPAADTAARLAEPGTDDPGFDLWLVPDDYYRIAHALREQARSPAILTEPEGPIAHSPLVFYVHKSRFGVLAEHCRGSVNWACVLQASATENWSELGGESTWGPFKPFVPDPVLAGGLLSLAGASRAVIGSEEVDAFAVRSDAVVASLSHLARARRADHADSLNALTRMLAGPAVYDVVVGFEVEGSQHRRSEAGLLEERVESVIADPSAAANLVAVGRTGSEAATRLANFWNGRGGKELLAKTGWDPGPAPAELSNPLSAAALITLRQVWEELT